MKNKISSIALCAMCFLMSDAAHSAITDLGPIQRQCSKHSDCSLLSPCCSAGFCTAPLCMEDGCIETEFADLGNGYMRATKCSCTCDGWVESVTYACAAGYYGDYSDDATGCHSCAELMGSPHATSNPPINPPVDNEFMITYPSNYSPSNCYIPAGITITDESGTFEYTQDCKFEVNSLD